MTHNDLKRLIREVPNWPKPGILFYDITTLLKDPQGFRALVDALYNHYDTHPIDIVAGIEARGFILAAPVAMELGAGFVPMRKPGKLPHEIESQEYELEYGTDLIEIHRDAIAPGERVLIVDDVLATGGTSSAAVRLVERLGGDVVGVAVLVELGFLGGRRKLDGTRLVSLVTYDTP